MTIKHPRTHATNYAPATMWDGAPDELRAIVWTRDGLVVVHMWTTSSRGAVNQILHFETVAGGKTWTHAQERPPSRHVTKRGAATMARRWAATIQRAVQEPTP